MRGWASGIAFVVALAACGHDAPRPLGPAPVLPEPTRVVRKKLPPEWFWEGVDVAVDGAKAKKVDLPASVELARTEGAARVWDDLGAEGQERLRRDGVVVIGDRDVTHARMGALYMELREQRIPYVLTLDALFYVVHVAFERALAEVEDAALVPALDALVPGLARRLEASQKDADADLAGALRLARGVVAVAAAAEGLGKPPDDLAAVVAQETAAIDAHAGRRSSPLLGIPIDYARFAVPSGAGHPGAYKALAWLASAPFALCARSEVAGAPVDVAVARTHARAAMLLARLVDHDGDPRLHEDYERVAKLLAFLWGPPDDVSPSELADAAESLSLDLGKPATIADVTRLDRVRRRAATLRAPRVFDGALAPGKAGASVRLFGPHASSDSVALASLAAPAVAARSLPSTIDVAAWLGGAEARACLKESGTDGAAGFAEALERAAALRPTDDAVHASVYGSLLDAIATWLAPRGASSAEERASVESALAAWTWIRHDGRAMSRPKPPRAQKVELRVPGGPLPAWVEPACAVIARLLATVRQIERGLAALGPLPHGSPALTTLAEVENMLAIALRVATREVADQPIPLEDVAVLGSMPARIASLEASAEAYVPVAADVYTDLRAGRALTSATGLVERVILLVREPGSGRLSLAVGAHVPQHEIVDPVASRTTDASLRARLDSGLSRGAYVSAFRRTRSSLP